MLSHLKTWFEKSENGMVTKSGILKEEQKPRWWEKLVNDCKEIIAEEQLDIIRRKHELGTRILKDEEKYRIGKLGKYHSGDYISDLASELGVVDSTIRDPKKFAEKFPDLKNFIFKNEILPDGKHITWTYIKENLIYEPRPAPAITVPTPSRPNYH